MLRCGYHWRTAVSDDDTLPSNVARSNFGLYMASTPRLAASRDSTFITTITSPYSAGQLAGLRVAIKDLFDLKGTVTTAGSAAISSIAVPALRDAQCLTGLRAAERSRRARIIGKLNLHELAYGGDGMNPHYGTPPNPLDATRVPGGSSSGSASAVGRDIADIAFGSDTGGSIRIPAACCGVVGLKTTWGRIPLEGVWPLAPSLDTAGPLAATVAGVIEGMDLLEPGFAVTTGAMMPATRVGRLRHTGVDTHPALDASVDEALRVAGFEVIDLDASWWGVAIEFGLTALIGEAHQTLGWLLDDHRRLDRLLEPRIAQRIAGGSRVTDVALRTSLAHRADVVAQIDAMCRRVDVLVTPTLPILAPSLGTSAVFSPYTAYTRPANLAGTPALAVPIPLVSTLVNSTERHLMASMQLMGPAGSEALLCATGRVVEAAVG
jgi:amidase